MPGLWLTRVARRLARADTFEHMVSPAIADLQSDAHSGWSARTRHYVAIFLVIGLALKTDLGRDMARAFDTDALHVVWRRALLWAVVAGVFNAAVVYLLTVRVITRWQVTGTAAEVILNGVVYKSILPALAVAMIVAAYNLKRRTRAQTRIVVAATIAIAAVAAVSSYTTNLLEASSIRALDEAGRAVLGWAPTMTTPPPAWRAFGAALHMVPFAWLGVVLARRTGWALALGATAILGTWSLSTQFGFPLIARLSSVTPALDALLFGIYAIPWNFYSLLLLIAVWRILERRIDALRIREAR